MRSNGGTMGSMGTGRYRMFGVWRPSVMFDLSLVSGPRRQKGATSLKALGSPSLWVFRGPRVRLSG